MSNQIDSRQFPFTIAVISDEISQDFDYACYVIATEFKLRSIELRSLWNKNLQSLSDTELSYAETILTKYHLRVTDIASPLFKVDWPDAPPSRFSTASHSFHTDFTFEQQQEVLERSIALAKRFKTDRIRCFDFWRLDDVGPHREAINAKLLETATICGEQGVFLLIENEFTCNTATGREAAETLAAIHSPYFMLTWDPGNAVMAGELDAFAVAWKLLPKQRIGHCHCKNAAKDESGAIHWAPIGTGYIDWNAHFEALIAMEYRNAISLETHWRGANTSEVSTRICWQQMKRALEQSSSVQHRCC
jgi:sugar phosphate isomerase/epimerase